jgi:hypothetical protein
VNHDDRAVNFSYDVHISHYPEMAVRYWFDKWAEAWETQEYMKRHYWPVPFSSLMELPDVG